MDNTNTAGFDTGFDFCTGAGFIQADAALRSFANPISTLTGIGLPTGGIPGNSSFTFQLTGNYFLPQSKVRYGGSELPTTVISSTLIQATAANVLTNGNK